MGRLVVLAYQLNFPVIYSAARWELFFKGDMVVVARPQGAVDFTPELRDFV
jgi:hypothetical protein